VFVVDDAFEGGAAAKRHFFDDFELIGESDTREGVASTECPLSLIRNVAVFTEYHAGEMATATERKLRNALKFGHSGEVNSMEGGAHAEGSIVAPSNCSEVVKPQEELNGAVGEALIQQSLLQCVRTKLVFDVRINDSFLD